MKMTPISDPLRPEIYQISVTPAISLYIRCESQEEVDYVWDKLIGWELDFGQVWCALQLTHPLSEIGNGALMGMKNEEDHRPHKLRHRV
jgi:hypothetical protein